MVKFLRRDCARFSKFGKGRGKKAKWRAPKGRDNKMREKIKGHPATVSIGYGTKKITESILISNPSQLNESFKGTQIIVSSVGAKKKIEKEKKAKEKGLELKNIKDNSL